MLQAKMEAMGPTRAASPKTRVPGTPVEATKAARGMKTWRTGSADGKPVANKGAEPDDEAEVETAQKY
jgi:hypothetical protein